MRAKLLFAVSAAAFLAACANMDIPGVRGMTDTGSAFDAALHQAYSDLAQAEYDEADWADARYFTNRAKTAAMGQDTGPQPLADRNLPQEGLAEISRKTSIIAVPRSIRHLPLFRRNLIKSRWPRLRR